MHVGYGLTEASPTIAFEREDEPRKPGSTGRPVEGVEVRIVGEDGKELPRGEVGEICARGENVTRGYLGMPDATAETFRDGLHTGDMGLSTRTTTVRGRAQEGPDHPRRLNIYPKDVEEVLYRTPAVRETAVVGVPDMMMGEQVCRWWCCAKARARRPRS